MIRLEVINEHNRTDVLRIDRSDISEDWVDSIGQILETTQYGLAHGYIGHTYAIYVGDVCIGIILMGEGIHWACDPVEVADAPFYRIIGFVLDRQWRGKGLGGQVLDLVINRLYAEFGPRPIVLGVQVDNTSAARFYERHGFRPTTAMDEDDRFYIRYPQ